MARPSAFFPPTHSSTGDDRMKHTSEKAAESPRIFASRPQARKARAKIEET